MSTTTNKAASLAAVTRASRALGVAQDRAAARQAERDAMILSAQRAGATYPELAKAAGLTRDRIRQVLAAIRSARSPE